MYHQRGGLPARRFVLGRAARRYAARRRWRVAVRPSGRRLGRGLAFGDFLGHRTKLVHACACGSETGNRLGGRADPRSDSMDDRPTRHRRPAPGSRARRARRTGRAAGDHRRPAAQAGGHRGCGIHDAASMPFSVPWTDVEPADFATSFAAYHWRCRADFSVGDWSLNLAVFHEGDLVGMQGLAAKHYLVTRSAETGSWLGRAHQGRGIGTAMRQAMCAFALRPPRRRRGDVRSLPRQPGVARGQPQGRLPANGVHAAATPRGGAGRAPEPAAQPGRSGPRPAPAGGRRTGGVPTLDRPGFVACPRAWQNDALSSVACPDPLIRPRTAPRVLRPGTPPGRGALTTTTSEETPQTWPSRSV